MTCPSDRPVVIIDDDPDHLDVVATYLERAGFGARGFTQPREALYHLIDHPALLAVVDLYMPDMDGIEIVRRLQAATPDLPVIGITGARDQRTAVYLRALRDFGAKACLRKPLDRADFLAAVHRALG
jgi:DNA-binding NtrC family response regulator